MRQCIIDGSLKELQASIPDIRYLEMKYDNFDVREVIVEGVNVGEFHVNLRHNNPVKILSDHISGEISLIDPENYLNLEHNIYIKTDPNSMGYMSIGETFTYIDEEISEGKYK